MYITCEETINRLSLYPWGICLEEPDENKRYNSIKRRKNDDLLWKGVFEDLFEDFLRFFFPDDVKNFDFNKGILFLDKELGQLFPPDDDEYAPRHVDKLARVFTRKGGEEDILVHVEVQGYRDKHFSERMFQYYYRIWDKFRRPLTALAILSDPNEQFHPKAFIQDQRGTRLVYSFNTYKILEQDNAELERSKNPFAMVLLIAKAALLGKKLDDKELYKLKIKLLKRLLSKQLPKKKIEAIMLFLTHCIQFADKGFNKKFEQNKDQLTKRRKTMGMKEAVREIYRLEGLDEGLEKGRLEAKGEIVKNLISQMGLDDQQVVKLAGVSLTFVKKMRRELKRESKLLTSG